MAIAVSIHAPRAGCDSIVGSRRLILGGFNSRTPCGVRQFKQMNEMQDKMFQFTHPVRGATTAWLSGSASNSFQFTHPVRGATAPSL